MDIDRGKVHQEVDKIVGQSDRSDKGIDFIVEIMRYETHYVRALDGRAAITLALARAPDWEGIEIFVEEEGNEDEGNEFIAPDYAL